MLQGRVNLKNPDHKFWLIETDDYGVNNGLPPVAERRIFFGREIGAADRKLIPTYQLKSRNYLGPTAMDAEVAFWPTRHWLNLGNLSMTLLSALGVFLLLQLTSVQWQWLALVTLLFTLKYIALGSSVSEFLWTMCLL